ncbi:MAG: GAF domain-containing protein [Actinophytocola sp.]|nr:GAF domain-containing protein [Actinophytocola sp.]
MAHGSGSSTRALAAAREQFLAAETVQKDAVRDTILASWWRSRTWNVAADHIDLPYRKDPNLDTLVAHCARPILSRLQEQLNDLAVSVILTDESGVVLDRRTDDTELTKYLDRVSLAPGFSYAEEFVGTNGIGTALEGLQPTAVFGHEHYAEHLETLACAGVPIRHPVSGQVVGLLDLTGWSRDAGPLMMALAKATAQEIQKELTTQVGLRELSLFTEYLRACRRAHGIVFAINNDLVMTNEHARHMLDPQDQAAMLADAAELLSGGKDFTHTMDLPSGARARLSGTRVSSEAGPAGGVIRARLTREPELPQLAAHAHNPHLPGIVGSGALWLRACQDVLNSRNAKEWLTIDGESGAGKLAIIRAVHAHSTPAAPLTVIDFAGQVDLDGWHGRLRDAMSKSPGTIVLRHLDRLRPERQPDLAHLLSIVEVEREDGTHGPWLVATMADSSRDSISGDVIRHFPGSVTVPPLRHHVDDIRELVPFLLLTLSHNARLQCAPAAVQLMQRAQWPGNVEQLRGVLNKVVHRRRSGTIMPDDLPPEVRTITRRVLTPLESMERDAIVRGLLDAEGNKTLAAQSLGMSRATIYRKIRGYGIDIPD